MRPGDRGHGGDARAASAKNCTCMRRSAATWSAISRWSTAATRSIARGWAPAATAFPSIVEPEVIQFKKCKAKFILHVEKDTVWQRFNEDKFWRKHHCILTHGGGQPPRGVRRMLAPAAQRTEAAGLLPAGQRPVGILHLQRHQAGLDQPGLRVAADGDSGCPLPRHRGPAISSVADCRRA